MHYSDSVLYYIGYKRHTALYGASLWGSGVGSSPKTPQLTLSASGAPAKFPLLASRICAVLQGTLSHMSPEALLRGHISKAADVYSFGVTLWELFTGCHAYHGKRREAASRACMSL